MTEAGRAVEGGCGHQFSRMAHGFDRLGLLLNRSGCPLSLTLFMKLLGTSAPNWDPLTA
jgi:hypothetical protein